MDYNPRIIFHLLQQKLIELIREGNVEGALEFAQEEVAPKGEANPEFLVELEKTMTLLILAPNGVPLTGTSDLLDPYHRIRVANEVNAALLASQGLEAESKLPSLLQLLLWSQDQLAANANFPKINNLIEAAFTLGGVDKANAQ